MSRRRPRGSGPKGRATPPRPRRGPSPSGGTWRWLALGALAVVALVFLRPWLALAVRAVADGDRGVAAALGVVPWVVGPLGLALVGVVHRSWPLWLGLWLFVLGAPGLSRRDSGRVERALEEQAPGYIEGWLVGMGVFLVLLTGWYVWARATGRLRT